MKLLITVLLIMIPGYAIGQSFTHAREVLPGTTFHRYIGSEHHRGELYKIAMGWDAALDLQKSCQSQRSVSVKDIVILAPVELDGTSAHPAKGAWQERF